MPSKQPFWQSKTLEEMNLKEWESLCDGCGKCCMHKLEDDDTGEVYYTNVACRLLDHEKITCKKYSERKRFVPDCISLTPELLKNISWLPETCAYLLLKQGKQLPQWHHLISGNKNTIHEKGVSVRGNIVSEREAGDLKDHIVDYKTF